MSAKTVDHSDASLQMGQVQNGALVIHCTGQVCISIRPADPHGESLPPALLQLVGALVAPVDIKALLPDWASLHWAQIPPSDLSNGEWVAHANGYRVNAYGDPGTPTFHDGVLRLMLTFLGEEGGQLSPLDA